MAMRVPIFSASSRSWLTKRMVRFSCRCRSSSSSWSFERISGSSAEKGSSIRRIGASVAKARARPTRCCMPPESSCAYLPAQGARPTSSSCFFTRAWRSAFRHAGELQAEAGILGDRAPGKQRELLEDHGDAVHADAAQRLRIAAWRRRPCRSSSCTRTRAAHRLVQAVDGAHQRRLAGAGEAHQHGDLAFADIERSVGDAEDRAALREDVGAGGALVEERQRLAGALAEDDVDVLEGDDVSLISGSPPGPDRRRGRRGRA